MSRRHWPLLGALALGFLFLSATAAGAQAPLPDPEVKADTVLVEPFETGRFVVRFDATATLTPSTSRSWDEQGDLVVDSLQKTAARAQAQAISMVESTSGATYESHWISNALVVDGPAELIDRLRALAGVAEVRPELARPIQTPVRTEAAPAEALTEPTWGVEKIGAPEAWAQGVLGGGVVVASLDSGVQFDHPALVDKYRGNLGGGLFDHNYNWFDASRTCADPTVPCDDLGHGTHTMGTMVGGDGPGPFAPDVGVAPGAQWMSVSCGPFFCTDGQLMEAGEWLLAPRDLNGENPDPARRPDIINNSWGGGPGDPFFLDFVRAWRAAGIVPAFAAGNPGPFCGAGGSPGDYLEAFSVGATDVDDVIADFSGRGPSVFGKVNPDVSAPGVNVLSSVPGDGFEFFDGTSMATPHVVGALALMMSADPALKGDVDGVTRLLASTAIDIIDQTCGGDADGDPNNVYGEGRIDAAAAVALVATGGTLTGTVTDAATGSPVGGAEVTATSPSWESRTFTGPDGRYSLFVPADTYVVTADSFGYSAEVVPGVVVVTDGTTTQDLSLTPLPVRTVRGVVRSAESNEPIARATVEVVGTPVEPVTTDRRGRFRIELPIGSYTLRGSQGGCLVPQTVDIEVAKRRSSRAELLLPTKIDDHGHGCRPVRFDWIEAETQSGTYGDDLAGRLELPFDFPFYDQTYRQVYFTTNGYLSFLDDFGFSNPVNSALPSAAPPNAAIYVLWQDLVVDDQARIDYTTKRVRGQRVFVIEWEGVAQLGTDNRLDMEVKLWEDGRIDVLYGPGVETLGGGSSATVGLENADATDAFEFSFRQGLLEPNTAWRFERVPTGIATGTVTNANDGLPIAGATVTAAPGSRAAVTSDDGVYRLRLVPGRYDLTVAADDYVSATTAVVIEDGEETGQDFSLDAAAAAIEPLEVTASVALGETQDVSVTVSNSGGAPLEWELRERQESVTPPGGAAAAAPAPEVIEFRRDAEWARPDLGERPPPSPEALATLFAGPLDVVVDDPVGDAEGPVDVDDLLAGTDGTEASFRFDFDPGTPMTDLAGYLFLDTDQDPTTGLPAEGLSGLPGQDVGMEYFVDLFSASFGEIFVVDANTFELVAVLPASISGQSLSFDVPLEGLGGDDGAMNVAAVLGNFEGPTDWVPDEGHGEVLTFRDTDWMTPEPASGTTDPGGTTGVTLTLGGTGVDPGSYTGTLTLVSNDPRQPQIPVTVTLDVAMPDDFGTVTGRVANARTSQPIEGAEVTLTAERDGAPYVTTATTDADGGYRLFGPAGTWPVTVVAEGLQAFEGEVVITAGGETTFDVDLDPGGPQIVISAEEFLDFELPEGQSASLPLNIANTGTEDVTFDIFERIAVEPLDVPRPTTADGSPYRWDPADRPVIDDRIRSQVLTGIDPAATLDTVIDDPDDDAEGLAEILGVRAGTETGVITIAVDFGPATVLDQVFGLALLDVDQNTATGVPPTEIGGNPTQTLGVEWFIDLFLPEGVAALIDHEQGTVVAFLELRFDGQTVLVDLPLGLIPGEEGGIDLVVNFSDQAGLWDWAPDEGRGRILPEEVTWLTATPTSGTVAPGADTDVTVTADATGLDPAVYRAELVVTSNDPSLPSFPVPVSLTVPAP